MKLLNYFLISLFICGYVESFQLNCAFQLFEGREECQVNKLKVLESDIAITEVSGTFTSGNKTNDDVKEFWIQKFVETEIVPTKVCNFLKNLERVDIFGKFIYRINREVFTNCKKVFRVDITYTSLTSLPEDLFTDLIELKTLNLDANKLVTLPADLILENTKLIFVNATHNRLIFIDTNLPSTLTWVDFRGNVCIDKKFPGDITDFSVFIQEVASKCESPLKKSFRSKKIAFNKTLSEKEVEIVKLKQKKEEIENEKIALATNITQLVSSIKSLKIEIEGLNTNNIINLTKTLEEIDILKLNISNLVIALTEKGTNVSKLVEQLNASSESNKLFLTNLTQINGEHQQMIENMKAQEINSELSIEYLQNLTRINKNLNSKLYEQVSWQEPNHFVYFITLAIIFGLILITIVALWRNVSRNLNKQTVNYDVSMKNLIENE